MEDVLVYINKFYFFVGFIIIDTEPVQNSKKHISNILGQSFLTISDAYIQCRVGNIHLSFAIMTTELNIFKIAKQPCNKNERIADVDLIRELVDHIFPSTLCDNPLQTYFAYIVLHFKIHRSVNEVNVLLDPSH